MRVAVIDIGTNTFNLLIASMVDEKLVLEHVEKSFVFLGRKGINKNIIQSDAIERAIETLKSYAKVSKEFKVSKIIAIATSAVRNAKNRGDFTKEVFNKTGIKITTISGNTEAEYIYKGAKSATDFGQQPILLMDIGGGSTEFIICNDTEIFWKKSIEIGAARLLEQFHKTDPISEAEKTSINTHLKKELSELFLALKSYNIDTLIGSAGVFTSLAKIISSTENELKKLKKTSEYQFDLSKFSKIHNELLQSTLSQRLKTPGLITERAPMIVVGTILVNFITEQFKIKNFRLARYALKEGVASDYFSNL